MRRQAFCFYFILKVFAKFETSAIGHTEAVSITAWQGMVN